MSRSLAVASNSSATLTAKAKASQGFAQKPITFAGGNTSTGDTAKFAGAGDTAKKGNNSRFPCAIAGAACCAIPLALVAAVVALGYFAISNIAKAPGKILGALKGAVGGG